MNFSTNDSILSKFVHFRVISNRSLLLIIISSLATVSFAQVDQHSAIKINNFGQVDEHYYRGAQPKKNDYQDLVALGIKTVINLTSKDTDPNEQAMVEKAGLEYHQIPMDSHTPPTSAQVDEFLRIVNNPRNLPVFVHCAAGKHRTGVMTAVYRLINHGWTADQAYKEMKKYKFGLSLFHPKLKKFVYEYYKSLSLKP